MARIVHEAGNHQDISFAEAGTLPYLARQHGSGSVAITKRATRLPTGVFPLRNKAHALGILKQAYPAVEDAGDECRPCHPPATDYHERRPDRAF